MTWHILSLNRPRQLQYITHAHTAWTNIHTVLHCIGSISKRCTISWTHLESEQKKSQKNTKGTWLFYRIIVKGSMATMVAIDLELEYLRYFAQFYCLAKEICSYKNGPKDPLNKGNIFEAACFVLHRFWHKDPPCSQFPDVPVLLLAVLIKQKIVTHSADKTEDIV